MRVGLVVTKKAREFLGDDFLMEVYKAGDIPYVAEMGDYLKDDVKDNDLHGLLVISETDMTDFVLSADESLGINPLAIEVIPLKWFEKKGDQYRRALILAYLEKLKRQDGVYRLQPVRTTSISKRSLIKFRIYEYRLYPVLSDSLTFEREIKTLVESCPKDLISKSIEGVTVTDPSECSGCGYCTAKGYLGYFEMPNLTTEQVVAFINTVLENFQNPRALVFTSEKDLTLEEGQFPLLVPSVASVHDSFIAIAYASGLVPIIVVPDKPNEMELKRLEEVPSFFPGTKLPIYKVKRDELSKVEKFALQRTKVPDELVASKFRRRSLYVWALQEMSKKVDMDQEAEVPGVYFVEVDPNKCVMCGVCVRACQMMVPDLKTVNNELTYLEYNIPFCIGSQRCVRNCPENAIKVERLAKVKELRKFTVNQAVVVKCRYCGKPVGNVKIKGRVDGLLGQYGYEGTKQYTDVCNECKQKVLTKMWLENYLKLRGELK